MNTTVKAHNTQVFSVQAGISFGVALLTTLVAIFYVPADPWIRAFLAMCTLFLTTSAFALATCLRDVHEISYASARLDQARVAKTLAEHDPFDAA